MMWQHIQSRQTTHSNNTKRIIASFGTADQHKLYDVFSQSKYRHAVRFDENFIFDEYTTSSALAAWHKLSFILNLFEKYDLVLYIDADAGICNIDYNIFDLVDDDKDITIAKTSEGINTGVFAIHKNDRTISALKAAQSLYTGTLDRLYEEPALVKSINEAQCSLCFVDETVFNASIITQSDKTAILHLKLDIAKTWPLSTIQYWLKRSR